MGAVGSGGEICRKQGFSFESTVSEGELRTDSLSAAKSDAAAYFDVRGNILFAEGVDFRQVTSRPFPAALRARLRPDSALLKLPRADSFVRGLVQLPEGVMMVAVRPVINSSGTGPVKGAFLLGRFLNKRHRQTIVCTTAIALVCAAIFSRLSADFATAREYL